MLLQRSSEQINRRDEQLLAQTQVIQKKDLRAQELEQMLLAQNLQQLTHKEQIIAARNITIQENDRAMQIRYDQLVDQIHTLEEQIVSKTQLIEDYEGYSNTVMSW